VSNVGPLVIRGAVRCQKSTRRELRHDHHGLATGGLVFFTKLSARLGHWGNRPKTPWPALPNLRYQGAPLSQQLAAREWARLFLLPQLPQLQARPFAFSLNRLRGWRRWEQLFRSRIPKAQKKTPMHPGRVRSRFVSIRHLLEHQRPAPSRDRILRKTRNERLRICSRSPTP
jgi:hypothetical protein